MRALGIHTYFGGMQLGMRKAGFEDLGSIETWKPAIGPRTEYLGLKTLTMSQGLSGDIEADMVYANPPCSRYSSMSASFFTDDERGEADTFPDILEAVEIVRASGANMLWWETGPNLWSKGMKMVADVAGRLADIWDDDVTSTVCKVDLRNCGVPQRRPRCHVMHFRGNREVIRTPHLAELQPITIEEWLRGKVGTGEPIPVGPIPEQYGVKTHDALITVMRETSNFMATRPSIIPEERRWVGAVLSGRFLSWERRERWFSIQESAALQSYPPDLVALAATVHGPRRMLTLLSKSVSPSAVCAVAPLAFAPDSGALGPSDIWKLDASKTLALAPWERLESD
jgi:site-specific DNA-cytosine methylase